MRAQIRGGVAFTAGGQAHCLAFTINALCVLEEVTGQSIQEVGAQLQSGNVSLALLRTLFWAGLTDEAHETGADLDLFAAGEMVQELGHQQAGALIGEAMQLAFPETEAETAPKNPRKPAARRPTKTR